jgi:biopolymer transport protein ExbB
VKARHFADKEEDARRTIVVRHATTMSIHILGTLLWQTAGSHWDLMAMLRSMSNLARGVVSVLLLMFLISVVIAIDRSLRFRAARHQSHTFIWQAAESLRDGNFDEASAIAGRNRQSHIARVVAGALLEFQSASRLVSDDDVIEVARNGLARAVAAVHAEMKSGLSGLATIGSTAPFVGLFGTVIGIVNSFRGESGQKAAVLSAVTAGIAEALVTTALGLLVAVPAVWCYNYFNSRMESFDIEMENSSQELTTYLVGRLKHRQR